MKKKTWNINIFRFSNSDSTLIPHKTRKHKVTTDCIQCLFAFSIRIPTKMHRTVSYILRGIFRPVKMYMFCIKKLCIIVCMKSFFGIFQMKTTLWSNCDNSVLQITPYDISIELTISVCITWYVECTNLLDITRIENVFFKTFYDLTFSSLLLCGAMFTCMFPLLGFHRYT